jgi:hypothetical protein
MSHRHTPPGAYCPDCKPDGFAPEAREASEVDLALTDLAEAQALTAKMLAELESRLEVVCGPHPGVPEGPAEPDENRSRMTNAIRRLCAREHENSSRIDLLLNRLEL